jgi:hypothetical protein
VSLLSSTLKLLLIGLSKKSNSSKYFNYPNGKNYSKLLILLLFTLNIFNKGQDSNNNDAYINLILLLDKSNISILLKNNLSVSKLGIVL